MPFNEALAWFGMTALATGLFIIFERHLKTKWSILLAVLGLVAVAYAVYQHNAPSSPKLPQLWIVLLFFTWAVLGYDIYLHKKAPVPATSGGLSAATSAFAGNLAPLHIPGPGSGSARSVEFTTSGIGDQEIDLGVHPKKLLFEPGGIVGEGELEKSLQFFGHEVTIRRFTNRGFVINDNEERLTVKVSVLESVTPQPTKTPGAMTLFLNTQAKFLSMKFSEQVALKLIRDNHGSITWQQATENLVKKGFQIEPENPIDSLMNKTEFVRQDFSTGLLEIEPALIDHVDEVLAKIQII